MDVVYGPPSDCMPLRPVCTSSSERESQMLSVYLRSAQVGLAGARL